jgi:DNA-binding LacI/PurR family transcriptional regulator
VSGINTRLSRSEYVLNLIIASDDPGDKTSAYVRSGAVDGAIVVSHHTSDTFIDRIANVVPVVYGGAPCGSAATTTSTSTTSRGREATEYLIGRGFRRIATIAGPSRCPPASTVSWASAMRSPPPGSSRSPRRTATSRPTAAPPRCSGSSMRVEFDALFVASDLMARGALAALGRAGIRVPEDVAIVGFDDSPVARTVSPQLTTMRQPSTSRGSAWPTCCCRSSPAARPTV